MTPPPADRDDWSARCRDALARYAEPRLRAVASKLIKPRGPQPLEELLDKVVATLNNPPVIDRRIRELPDASRKVLAAMGLSRQPRWKVEHLITLVSALGYSEGFAPIATAIEAGLLFPIIPVDVSASPSAPSEIGRDPQTTDASASSSSSVGQTSAAIDDFTSWLGSVGTHTAEVFVHPAVAVRARSEPLGLAAIETLESPPSGYPRRADGLDWPLRLAVARQLADAMSIRFTQANLLFKKDLIRLQTDEVLSAPFVDHAVSLADTGVLALLWAIACGLLVEQEGELRPASGPSPWEAPLPEVLADLFASWVGLDGWDPLLGYAPTETGLSPTATAGLLALLLLAQAMPAAWVEPGPIADWLWSHHPTWAGTLPETAVTDRGASWVRTFLLGVAYPLQLVEVLGDGVRLSALGRHLLAGGPQSPAPPAFPQTLLVQPNAEILAYRQGLTPGLIATLSRFARWKGLGPACTLELTPEQTYRGLESGLTLPMILQTLSQSSTRPIPPAVTDLLQRWASKRERITVFASAVLVEFATPAELEAAIARGIVAIRLSDRIGITADGSEPKLAQLRLYANRDYESKPQRCVTVAEDGMTMTVDAATSDLLLDAEIGRYATPLPSDTGGPRRYRLTAEQLRRAGQTFPLSDIDMWFFDRTGQPLSPAGRLLLLSPQLPPATAGRMLVVRFPSVEVTDGAMQWPETRAFIAERLGPTAVSVAEEHLDGLKRVLAEVGMRVTEG